MVLTSKLRHCGKFHWPQPAIQNACPTWRPTLIRPTSGSLSMSTYLQPAIICPSRNGLRPRGLAVTDTHFVSLQPPGGGPHRSYPSCLYLHVLIMRDGNRTIQNCCRIFSRGLAAPKNYCSRQSQYPSTVIMRSMTIEPLILQQWQNKLEQVDKFTACL